MPGNPDRRKKPIKGTKGPVQPGSVLYRILQRIAQEIVRSLNGSRGDKDTPGDPSETQ